MSTAQILIITDSIITIVLGLAVTFALYKFFKAMKESE